MSLRAPVRALTVMLALVLAGCTGEAEEPAPSPGDSTLPERLEPVWSTKVHGFDPGAYGATPVVYAVDDRILYAGGGAVAAVDASTGTVTWQRRTDPDCTTAAPNAVGDVVFTLGGQCRDVAVLDGETGEQRWRTHIPSVDKGSDFGNVIASIGDSAVTVIHFGGRQVTRLSLRDGHRLGVQTLRLLGLRRSATAPPPASCFWTEQNEAEHWRRALRVKVTVAEPDQHGNAVTNAKRAVQDALNAFGPLDPSVTPGLDPHRGVLSAAREALDPLRLSLGADSEPSPGRYESLGDACAVLRDEAARLGTPDPI